MSPETERLLRRVLPGCVLWVLGSSAAGAASLAVAVTFDGAPIEGAVVSLHSDAAVTLVEPVTGEMDQVDFAFVPQVLVIPTGSKVDFPNRDQILHHVYSFSPAKAFELPLYSGRPSSPVLFDTAGVVVLGCNIHDTMVGYIVVLDTPYQAQTGADGVAHLDAPAGDYALQVWHVGQPHPGRPVRQDVQLDDVAGEMTVAVERAVPISPPTAPNDRVQQLQQRFRALRTPPAEGRRP